MNINLSKKQIMNRIYKNVSGFEIPKDDERHVKSSKGSPVYGEITHASMEKLLSYLSLTNKDIFYDLGSGVGKVILHTALFSPVKKAIGIELSKTRYDDAMTALQQAAIFQEDIKSRCEFHNADLLTIDLSKASIIYTCSTAFSLSFMRQVGKRLAHFTHPFRLVTLQDLPIETGFTLLDTLKLDMSWIRKTPVYIYKRNI